MIFIFISLHLSLDLRFVEVDLREPMQTWAKVTLGRKVKHLLIYMSDSHLIIISYFEYSSIVLIYTRKHQI